MEQERAFSRPRALRDILVVGSPVVVLGAVGNLVGLDTLAGGAIINLGYVLMIIVGGFILRRQGSSWREIGLTKPPSWWKTALYGVGAFAAAVVAFLAVQTIAVGLLTALGPTPAGIDESRFNEIKGNLPFFTWSAPQFSPLQSVQEDDFAKENQVWVVLCGWEAVIGFGTTPGPPTGWVAAMKTLVLGDPRMLPSDGIRT